MENATDQRLHFAIDKVLQPIYTGGDISANSSNSILAACVGEDALLTDLATGDPICRIEGDGEALTALQISPDANHLAVCSRSLSMRIYSLQHRDNTTQLDAILLKSLKPHNTPVVTLAIDETSTLVATGSADGAIKVWDLRAGYTTHTFRGHSGIVSALKFFRVPSSASVGTPAARGGKKTRALSNQDDGVEANGESEGNAAFRLASGGDDGQIKVWDLVKRKAVATLNSHVSVIRGLSFSTQQNALVSSSRDKTFIVWDARTWKARKVIPVFEVIEDSIFLCDGNVICTGGESGNPRLWSTDTGIEITRAQAAGGDNDTILKLITTESSHELITVRADQTLVIFDYKIIDRLTPGAQIDAIPLIRRVSGTHDEVIDLAFVSLQKKILALSTNSESVRLVSVQSGIELNELTSQRFGSDIGLLQGHEDIVISMDVDWSGCWLATGAKDNTARLWRIDGEAKSFTCYSIFTGHAESLGAVALPKSEPQSSSMAFQDPLSHPPAFLLTGSQDKTIKRWAIDGDKDRKRPKALYTRLGHEKDINAISINGNGALFASASQDKTVKVWSVEEGEVQGILRGHKRGVWSVAFAPKSLPAIMGDSGGYSSGGRGVILTGSGDKTVKIWSLTDYSCLRTFEGHTNSVLKVLWLPPPAPRSIEDAENDQGQRFSEQNKIAVAVSSGSDGLVRLWDVQSGESLAILDNHTDRVWALAAQQEQETLVSGGADSVITLWKNVTAATVAAQAHIANERVEQEQQLTNHVQRGNYREAIVLALTLNHPARLLSLFTSISRGTRDPGSLSGLHAVDEVLATLSDDQLFALLLRIRDWNTNARTATVAQTILNTIIQSYSRNRIVQLANAKGRQGLNDILEALKAYTERHYRRMEDLVEESYIVDFVVRGMGEEGFVEDTTHDMVMVGGS